MRYINYDAGLNPKLMDKSITGRTRISECKQAINGKHMMLDYLADLNPQQRQAVKPGIEPPIDGGPAEFPHLKCMRTARQFCHQHPRKWSGSYEKSAQ
jgi:hypothetical protein